MAQATQLRNARRRRGWTQHQAARRLKVSQAYWSMLESGHRKPSSQLGHRMVRVLGLSPVALPLPEVSAETERWDSASLAQALAALGYPGFAYLRRRARQHNPAVVLLAALATGNLEARVAEALPWLLLRFPEMGFHWLMRQAKLFDLQNRLGFVVTLARRLNEAVPQRPHDRTERLRSLEAELASSRLAREDTFCQSLGEAERRWLREHRSKEAAAWNLLSDLRAELLPYAA